MEHATVSCLGCGIPSAAGKRFCAECGAALPLVCPACGHPVTAQQKFCDECGASLPGATPAGPTVTAPGSESARSSALAAIADRSVAPAVTPAPREERRLVTALFCDLVGFTPLSEQLDPEDIRAIQGAYFSAMTAQIERYGGIVEKYAGDAVLALFGVPLAHEDDPERAVLCALGVQRAMQVVADGVQRRYGVRVAIRVGVNTGEVVSGSWDVSGRQQAAVTGDAINVAARMQAAAKPGGVLVGEATMRLARRRIRFGERQELSLKGKAEPVAAYAAIGLTELRGERWEEERAGHATPLVGRGAELDMILAAWTRAQTGEGELLTIVGEPGVGKSRLVAESIERISAEGAEPQRLLRGRCLSYGQSVSLWLVADLLRSLCSVPEDAGLETITEQITATVEEVLSSCDETDRAIARDVLGEVLGLLPGGSLVAAAGPEIRRSSLIRSLGLVLGALAEAGRLLLILEDLHWLDTASAEILEALLPEVPGRTILVLATQRPGWLAPWSGWSWTERLALRPLPENEAAALAGAVLGGARLSPQLEAHLRERAEGNPFFVEELVRYLQETGGLEVREGEVRLLPGVAERLPATLTEVLLARLDRLESQVKGVAQVGSVIGRSFAVRLLARVMEREKALLDGSLRALQQAEIAFPRGGTDPEYIFKHVTVRDVAYSMLVRKRRRQLHLAVARAIAQLYPSDEYVEMIAYHYARTEEDVEAARWLEKAGDRARDSYANQAAIEHYQAALERLERSGSGDAISCARIEVELGSAIDRMANYEKAEEVLERAIGRYREAGKLGEATRATATLGRVLYNRGKLKEARKRLEETAQLLAERDPSPATAQLQEVLASVYQFAGRYRDMLRAANLEVEMARAMGDDVLRGEALERLGAALCYLGRLEESRAVLEEAISLLEESGRLLSFASAIGWMGENRRLAGDLAESRQLNARMLELVVRTGDARYEVLGLVNLAQLGVAAGEWEQAREHLTGAEEIVARQHTAAWADSFLPSQRGELALREGGWAAARVLLDRATESAAGANREIFSLSQTLLAELDILEGRPAEARDRLQGLVDRQGANIHPLFSILAWAHLELGETERALELAAWGVQEARERQTLLYLPEALRIKGMALSRLERSGEARTALTEGRERATAMPMPYTEARILIELGLLARQEGQGVPAREHLVEALSIFQRLGASKDIERAEQELAELDRSAELTR